MRTGLLVAVAAAVAISVAATPTAARGAGGWFFVPARGDGRYSPVPNVNDPHVQELGGWAVSEHDKKASDGLKFHRVVSADWQVVEGYNYRLTIDASSSSGNGNGARYEAVVWERDWTNSRELLSFKPAH